MVLILNQDANISLHNNQQFVALKDICEIKKLEQGDYIILLLDMTVQEDGFIKEIPIFFEEIIISIHTIAIITTKASEKLREICAYHKISLLEIETEKHIPTS